MKGHVEPIEGDHDLHVRREMEGECVEEFEKATEEIAAIPLRVKRSKR